ncbi:unnamed protein product [Arabis nemorensis]|uniref:Jacalin-type lectin domain-containing protein n=1 Tax=Arabis nemorensis TaxID=586526 RepID=A0A565C243_9BRAS|nr:unnamed protein product [Arabis nemorensis]
MVTSYSRYEELGMWNTDSRSYLLEPKTGLGPKLVGFLGKSSDSVNAIGARFQSSARTPRSSFFLIIVLLVIVLSRFSNQRAVATGSGRAVATSSGRMFKNWSKE